MNLVIDASVAVKWFMAGSPEEGDAERALELLADAVEGRHVLHQPPHFIAEVAAVLVRLSPGNAQRDVTDLQAIEFMRAESPAIYARAMRLADRHGQHVFDTLYHAVAIETPAAMLVTADRRYFERARGEGRIVMLAEFGP